MDIIRYPGPESWPQLLRRPVLDLTEIRARVEPVLNQVRQDGDRALRKLTREFDKVDVQDFSVSENEIEAAASHIRPALARSIRTAIENIRKFHQSQKEYPEKIETYPGVVCWRESVPIGRVGLYIPGGSSPLFSTLLMLGVPAQVAGCPEIVVCSPPDRAGQLHPAMLFCAAELGIRQIYKIGGAQAIAAMGLGTESIPRVDKIFGPGNQYVTAAKQLLQLEGIAIDLPAGPSEVAVVADHSARPQFAAADLLSQAEHGPDSQVLFICTDPAILEAVSEEVNRQLQSLPRREITAQALAHSRLILMENLDQAMALVNAYAPEHLILMVEDAGHLATKVRQAGSVFLGHYTPESAGDYASGTNHTLPTNGYARAWSGVSLDSFVKKITFQKISKNGLLALGETIEQMAEAEGLTAHRQAVSIRKKILEDDHV